MEKQIIEGLVKSIKKDRKGILLSDGKWYSHFSNEVTCKVGDNVSVEYKQNGDFRNFEKITILQPSNALPTSLATDRERSIIAQTMTKCWAIVNSGVKLGPEAVWEVYNKFLAIQG